MFNRKPIHRANASAGVDWTCELVRHAEVIVQPERKFKAQKTKVPLDFTNLVAADVRRLTLFRK
jgi:hypothetical protein